MRLQVLSGANLFSMYVGEGEGLLRSAFQRARMTAPSILFIDEIDAIVGGCCGFKFAEGDIIVNPARSTCSMGWLPG